MHKFVIFYPLALNNWPSLVTFTNHTYPLGETKSSADNRKKGNSCLQAEELPGTNCRKYREFNLGPCQSN